MKHYLRLKTFSSKSDEDVFISRCALTKTGRRTVIICAPNSICMFDLILFTLNEEVQVGQIKSEINGKFVSVVFDGTTHIYL